MFVGPVAHLCGSRLGYGVFIRRNLLPVTLGNIVGGTVIVALIQWLAFGSYSRKVVPVAVTSTTTSSGSGSGGSAGAILPPNSRPLSQRLRSWGAATV